MMSRSRTRKGEQRLGRSPVELVEEAVHLVRTAPSHLLLCYYVGTLPYVLALLYFWADMSRRGDARTRCAEGALLVAALFLWMKCWHTIFAQGLLARLCGAPSPKWTLPRAARMVVNQIAIQPTALVALPLSILALLPFAWLHAFYHNMTALDSGEAGGLRPVMRRAWAQAKLWPRQNHTVIWLISPALLVVAAAMFVAVFPVMQVVSPDWVGNFLNLYACIVALILVPLSPLGVLMTANFAFLMVAVPSLLKSLLGLETTLIVPPLNSTLLAAACSLTFVCMDPFMKAVYVLRCFYGESLATGEDLRAELRSLPPPRRSVRTLALVTAILVGCAAAASAGTPSEPGPGSAHVEQTGNSGAGQGATAPAPLAPHTGAEIVPADLDDAIGAVIQQREYVWRSPRDESLFPGAEQGPIVRFMERVYRTSVAILKKVFKWVARLLSWIFPSPRPGGAGMSGEAWIASLRALMYILIAALLVTILVLVWRIWRRSRTETVEATPEETPPELDLEDEGIGPGELPEDGWVALAYELAEQGKTRLALRALFLAGLARLGGLGFLQIAKYKSNRDYTRELDRRTHAEPTLAAAFKENVFLFERIWYGIHVPAPDLVHRFRTFLEIFRGAGSEEQDATE